MAKQVISSSDSGSQAVGKINDNFTELYGGTFSLSYVGERINLRKTWGWKNEEHMAMTSVSSNWRQGGAMYDKYFFQFHTTNDKIQVYDVETEEVVKTFNLTANANNHAGSGGFSNKRHTNTDMFPLLYLSSMDEQCIYVYRIAGASLDSATISLVQTITLPSASGFMYIPNVAIDADNDRMVVFGYTQNSWSSATNNQSVVASFKIPDTSSDVTLTTDDVLTKFYFPFIFAEQGSAAQNGDLIMSYGNSQNESGIWVIDYNTGIIKGHLVIAASGVEPEALGIYNEAIYYSTPVSGQNKMYKVAFE